MFTVDVKQQCKNNKTSFWDSQTSSPQTLLLTGLLGKTEVVLVVVVVVCVCGGGGDEAISKLKGAGQRVPSHAQTCMCPA